MLYQTSLYVLLSSALAISPTQAEEAAHPKVNPVSGVFCNTIEDVKNFLPILEDMPDARSLAYGQYVSVLMSRVHRADVACTWVRGQGALVRIVEMFNTREGSYVLRQFIIDGAERFSFQPRRSRDI